MFFHSFSYRAEILLFKLLSADSILCSYSSQYIQLPIETERLVFHWWAMHNVHVFNSFDRARLNQYALQLFPKTSFYFPESMDHEIFFVQVLILDSITAFCYLDFSETWSLSNTEYGQLSSRYFSFHLVCRSFPSAFLGHWAVPQRPQLSKVRSSSPWVRKKWCDWTPWKSWSLGFDEKAHRAPSGRGSGVGGKTSEGAWQNCSSADLSNVSARSRWLRDAFSTWKCFSLHVETVFVLCICSCVKIYVEVLYAPVWL